MPEGENVVEKYHMQKQVEGVKGLMEMLKEGIMGKRKVVKTVPMRPEWKALYDEWQALDKEHDLIDRKMNSKRKLFWATISSDLDEYRSMQVNEETGEVEVCENESEPRA